MEYRSVRQLHEEFNQQNDNEKKKKLKRWTSLNNPWNASMNRIACCCCCWLLLNEMSEDGDEVMISIVVAQQVISYDWCVIYVAKFKSMTTHLAVLIIKIFADMSTGIES